MGQSLSSFSSFPGVGGVAVAEGGGVLGGPPTPGPASSIATFGFTQEQVACVCEVLEQSGSVQRLERLVTIIEGCLVKDVKIWVVDKKLYIKTV